jgi:hypothetical protein
LLYLQDISIPQSGCHMIITSYLFSSFLKFLSPQTLQFSEQSTHSPDITLQSMQFGLSSLLVRSKSFWLECWSLLKVIKCDFFLSKEDVPYHEVVTYSEVQDVFSLLILFAISKTFMYPLKPPSNCANITIKVSFNEEFFTARHSNHVL